MDLERRTEVKVPEIIALFWVVKVLTTALGESVSDYSVHKFDPVLAVLAGFVVFVVALALQLSVRRYVAWVYWLTVAMVAVFGTMAADVTHVKFKVPYAVSTVAFAIVLAVVFVAWDRVEHTLSIHTVDTLRRELFYWATVTATFALGTAAGDLMAIQLHLGFFGAGAFFFGMICLPALAWRYLGLNPIAAFWWAYILTRPLGASFADGFGKPTSFGGLGLGDGIVAGVLAALIVALVAYLSVTKADVRPAATPVRTG
ncbi:MAG TPA: hypothetical protein VGZ03_07670 [Acidimicrobiales bacterium]|jgi:uncharacterized membrane-anchored protein|nr:hypothetical protein [Acidimicrobiales bacterium]